MKNKYAAIVLGLALTISSCPVYAAENTTEATTNAENSPEAETTSDSEAEENTVLGQVTAVNDDSITIAIGTQKEMQAPGGDGQGQAPDGQDPNGGADSSETLSLSDLKEGDIVSVVLNDDGTAASITVQSMGGGNMGGGMGAPGGQSQGVDSYTAVNTYSEDTSLDGDSIESTGTDENAVLVDSGANVSIKNATITRNSEASTGGDNSSFYGVGAAVLATDGTASVSDSTITTDAKGGAGLFAYGDSTIYAADNTITTHQDTSGGIHAAGGGTLYAWDLNVETNGESAAAIRSDRGGGTMVVDGGTYTSNGVGSPAVYCTANIAINNATLTANGSEAVCIEGLNSLSLTNCSLSGNIPENEQNDCDWTVILYQSMSGDSEIGESKFSMDGGSLTSLNGGLFYTTNTESSFYLKNVDITYSPSNNFFLKCTGNANKRGWGQSGNNGADCTFTADSQEMSGDILWDSISNLDLKLTNGTILTGSILQDETNAGDGGDGTCDITIDALSAWTVTGNSTVTSLTCNGSITGDDGKSVTIAGTDGTVFVQGTGKYTITTGSYNE